jgi:hypothetical protein
MPAMAAGRIERGATQIGVAVARSLYGRWRQMPEVHRAKLERIAEDVKARALDVRSEPAQLSGPEVTDVEVHDLRADLARELERLAGGEVKASRGSGNVAGR